ncbi:SMP-30/gluconolactonase/LRE family protein [Pelagibacterium halotolerans]|uniref:1,4-lactonase n=1 Tax=Pelagibacterium halotolerans (strain DSM 22347 / JCM 15775 / CGMCC 1.7692 / B2) TaxID=1082931 RepID=G4R7W0_PELHB|nr:SMP-30/gluconolactonase/LRE family protein [Pelagibacterium halotolerans]AEQ50255.1 1,4-lactonase [Pelagibacterium halotolerans B2]QJR19751.1 SMP-30/gluconolactonase/LRE family protein [Pelagibacterium halotolerans]SEA52006.1 Sugar lactone lactonase YvrE [Pelagibacterium halotolerans]
MTDARVFDDRPCFLGEGPLWHPEREQLFWFDIIGRTLLTRKDGETGAWTFDDMVSAAGWIDKDNLLIASETALLKLDIETRTREIIATLDLGEGLRTNDGRADPWGGFWFSSMSKKAEKDAGAIYRYYRGEVKKLFSSITIPNAICFSPDRALGYFADTDRGFVKRVALDLETGLPMGEPEIHLDLKPEGLNPDGAVIDAEGNMWLAQWGAGRVAVHDPSGKLLKAVSVSAPHTSCPAFGGADFSTLYCTTAREGLDAEALAAHPGSGNVFFAQGVGRGRPEPAVII